MSIHTDYLKDLLHGLKCKVPEIAEAYAPVYVVKPEGQPVKYCLREGPNFIPIAPKDNLPVTAFAYQTSSILDVTDATGRVIMRTTTARVVLVYGMDNDLSGAFSTFGQWQRSAEDYWFDAVVSRTQLDGSSGYAELFGQEPMRQQAVYSDFQIDLSLTACPPTCEDTYEPQTGCGPYPVPAPVVEYLTCATLAQCQVIIDIMAQFGPIENELQTLSSAFAALTGRVDVAEQDIQALSLGLAAAEGNIAVAQTTANTGVTNAATAQSTANTALANAATAQGTANTALANAATAQATANIGARWRKQQEMLLEGVGLVHRLLWSFTGNPTVLTLTANSYTYQTFVCDLPFAPTNLYLYIQTPQAGSTAQFALWDDSGVFSACPAPGQVIWSSAVFPAAASGLVVIPLTGLPALTPGARYYCGLICSSNAVEFRSYANAQMSILSNVLNTRVWRANNAGQSPGGTPPTNPTITAVNSSNSLLYLVS
jgi:hypothetical protein